MANLEKLRVQLAQLKHEHRLLDLKIQEISNSTNVNSIELQKLKRRKLFLKDEIARIVNSLLPDITA